jgi:AraC-like DNA-binding protein
MKSTINGLRISFPTDWLSAPFSLDWPNLAELSIEPDRGASRFPTQIYIRELLKEHLGKEDLDLDRFGKMCGMQPRSFQRYLAGQGTSFRELKDDVRRSLAIELLSGNHETMTDVAAKLGFSSISALDRAFRRWTGETPGTYRKKSDRSHRR